MPIYEYQCKHCGDKFEALQKYSDQPLTTCLKCGKDTLEKCVSLSSFQLKGKGWYESDYKAKKPSGEKPQTKDMDAKKPAKDDKKAEKKDGDKS